MLNKLKAYIEKHQLINHGEKVLVAASAGVDSTVLCYLLKELKIDFGIAHCNFKLRGEESDGDELFVEELAEALQVPFFAKTFATGAYARENKLSIQVAARQLRYPWLAQIVHGNNYQKLATAHHLDDNIETVLYNFSKGTGIKGMRGILPKNNGLIRPLLFAAKKEILEYAKQNGIYFREDKSNFSDKYNRNKIRHHIAPVFMEINPSFQRSAGETIEHLRDVENIYEHAIRQFKLDILELEKDGMGQVICWKINTEKLKKTPAPTTILFETIQLFGFNNSHAAQIMDVLDNQPGQFFFSHSHRLLIDREYLFVESKMELEEVVLIPDIVEQSTFDITGGQLFFQNIEDRLSAFPNDNNVALFDADKIKWPITLRRWSAGDYFKPLGMKGKGKKVQDFFTNQKLSRSEKERVWIMESGGDICWIVGMRIDERFKVSEGTQRCLVVEFLPGKFAE